MVNIKWGMEIPIRDGVRLAADLFFPNERVESAPVIVVRTPYGRQTNALVEQARYFATCGYAVLNVDVRGRGDSEGEFVPYRNEGKDGYDTVEWAAAQPWCSGAVGTLGASYLAKAQWLCALEKPPHLRAMIPLVSPSDPFVEWPTGVPQPPHLCWLFLTSGRMVQNIHAVDWAKVYEHLPLIHMDEAVGRSIPVWREECEHPYGDQWWEPVCYQNRFHDIDVPVLHISGWYDDQLVGTTINYMGMMQHAPSEWVRKAQRLLIGPWPHQVNASTKLGAIDFGWNSVIDLQAYERRFFDRWLKGMDNGADMEDPVRIFVMGINEWQSERAWPSMRADYQRWYLHSRGQAHNSSDDGMLSLEAPTAGEPPDTYVYNPHNPVPYIMKPTSEQIGGPDDYSQVHQRDDVLVYTSAAMEDPLHIAGPITVELFAASSAPDTDFMVQLHDVWPNGFAQRLCDGMVRVRFRHGLDTPELVRPGEVVQLTIDCWSTAHVFLPGHRIRLHVASSAFPKYDRNPNTGEDIAWAIRFQSAKQTVYHHNKYPSALILPVIRT
ncbi:CocE/NonD family hydrolase [Alicyclobacillus pomorum]